ncbi:MAG: deoxyribonuclease IV [Planctomycetaceae bacterium]
MLLGAHVSTAGGMPTAVQQGLDLSCEAIQVFTRNQRQWAPRPLDPEEVASFRALAEGAGFLATALSHASYLINPSATDPEILERSERALVDEIERCAALGIPFLALHPGAHLGKGEEAGLLAAAATIRRALQATPRARVTVLLESTAGQGTCLGHTLDHLRSLLRLLDCRRVAVCLDTCHLHAAGYGLKSPKAYEATLREVESVLGFERVKAFHLNDSKTPQGSRVDRHEHIGQGEIGAAAFQRLVRDERFRRLPAILETPGGPEGYAENLARLKKMRKRS